MPGPLAKDRSTKLAAVNSPNRKTLARLKSRQADYVSVNWQNGQQMHMPGSENRKK
jgi:hypothetical protein